MHFFSAVIMAQFLRAKAIGVDPSRKFTTCNSEVYKAFILAGDMMLNSALLLPELIEDDIRLLVYAGNAGKSTSLQIVPFPD